MAGEKRLLHGEISAGGVHKYRHDVPRAAHFLELSTMNLILLVLAVGYIAGNIVLLVLLSTDPDHNVFAEQSFHNLEFIGTFMFTVLNQFILVYAPPPDSGRSQRYLCVLKWVAMVNVLGSSISAMLVVIDLEDYEVPSHEMEYANSLLMALFDVLILFGRPNHGFWEKVEAYGLSGLGITVAILQPIIYNSMGWEGGCFMCGDPLGETSAHFVEFSFEILSGFVSARIIYDNKKFADAVLRKHYNSACCSYSNKFGDYRPVPELVDCSP